MEIKSEIGSSKEKPIEINEEDESSDGENSVIILDSDTEPDDRGGEDDENGDDEDSEVDDEDESDESEESDEDSDSSVDTESVNSVWSNVDEAADDEITTEAAEAKIIKKFEKAMICIADGDVEKGRKILEKLLDDPIIASFRQDDPDFEVLEEPPRLAKMLQIFIATHKNLAKLCEGGEQEHSENSENQSEEIGHLCQVLGYEPNNSEIWLDVAIKSVEFGDLNFAKYAFKRCENLKESLESHATLLYLTCDYTESLQILKQFQEQNDVLNDKMKYLKLKIRSTNQYYKILCDRIFEEDEVYADIDFVEKRKILAFDERIEGLRKRVEERKGRIDRDFEMEHCLMSTIPIQISADQDLPTVCTIFCDLFDRIHSYSHCRDQLIEITEWESRQDYLQVVETVEKLVDIVECVEELTEKTEEQQKKKKVKRQKIQDKKEYLANWRKRLFVERTNSEDVTESEACTTADEDEEQQQQEDRRGEGGGQENSAAPGMPENELAQEFHLVFSDVVSIRSADRKREKTPPPSQPHEFIDSDLILQLLSFKFSGGTHTILEILEHTLLLLSEHTPDNGALPDGMRDVTREMFNRFSLFGEIREKKYHKMIVFLMELDTRKAMEIMVLKNISPFWKDEENQEKQENKEENRSFILRFMWKYSQSRLKDEIKLDYLHTLRSLLHPEECIATSSGSFATWDVDASIDELEKKKRIDSVKHLWKSKNYQNLVEILQNDIDFSSIGVDETMEMLNYWVQSLEKLKNHVDLMALVARAMHFYLFLMDAKTQKPQVYSIFQVKNDGKIERNVDFLLQKLQKIHGKEFAKVANSTLSTIGYLICIAFKKFAKFEKEWKNWRILYEIVKVGRGNAREYIEQMDRIEDPRSMPLLELDLLVKAHEVLGEHHCCAQKNYEFLFFIIDRFRDIVDDIPILEMCYMKDNGYLWNNLNVELSQVLFCLYGKYGRKRRAREDHENGQKCGTTMEISKRVMAVILVQPLPLYDEKEKLSHDVVELLNSKFPFFLEISPEKLKKIKDFQECLQKSSSLEDVNSCLLKCRDDVDDYIQSLIWYAMSLNAFRQNSYKEATKYSELYLLAEESVHDDRLRSSVWGMLAHSSVHDLFQLDLHEIYEQWKWRIMPFRMALDAQQHEPVPHFELAAILYQLASSLARFHRTLPKTDARRQDISDVAKLRQESREQFDRSLELTRLGDDGSQPEHQWLCYYFTGKLEAKSAKWDILKVVESFYEAACGCELAGFYYPQRVQTKKQTNFEPLEVHYQAFSAVYKYLINNEMPDLDTLRKLKVLLKLLNDGHKVVKPSSSLFKVNIDVYTVMDELVMDTVLKEHGDKTSSETELCSELSTELKEMCYRAFTLITERFPHMKSHYRLAQLHFDKGEIDQASDQIFKNAFKRKKRDDGMFDNCIEISCNDINRNGSFCFHIERCIKLGAQIVQRTLDLHNVVAMLITMINIIVKDDEEHVEKPLWRQVISMYLTSMEQVVLSRDSVSASTRSTPSPGPGEPPKKTKPHHLSIKTLRNELWRLWQTLTKCSKSDEELIRLIKAKTEVLIVHCFKSIDSFKNMMHPPSSSTSSQNDGGLVRKKYNVMKRKFDIVDIAQPLLKNISDQAAASKAASAESVALKLAQKVQASPNAKVLNDFVRNMVQNAQGAQGASSNAKIVNDLAQKLIRAQMAQNAAKNAQSAAKASVPTTSSSPSTSKPPVVPLFAKKTAPIASTSTAPPPQKPTAPIVRPQPNPPPRPTYSPISSDDDIQCIEPPAKKPAPAGTSSSGTVPTVPPRTQAGGGAGIVPKFTFEKLTPGAAASRSAQNLQNLKIAGSSMAAQKTSTLPSAQSAPRLSTTPQKAQASRLSQPAANPTSRAVENAALAAILTTTKGKEDITNFILTNMHSTDPTRQLQAAQAYQLFANAQATAQAPAPQAPPPPPPPVQASADPMTQLIQSLQAAQKVQDAQKEAALKREKAQKEAALKREKAQKEAQERAKRAQEQAQAQAQKEKIARAQAQAKAQAQAVQAAKEQQLRQAQIAHLAQAWNFMSGAAAAANLNIQPSTSSSTSSAAVPKPTQVTPKRTQQQQQQQQRVVVPQQQQIVRPNPIRPGQNSSSSTSHLTAMNPTPPRQNAPPPLFARPQPQRPQQQVSRPSTSSTSSSTAQQQQQLQQSAQQSNLMQLLNQISDPVHREQLRKQIQQQLQQQQGNK